MPKLLRLRSSYLHWGHVQTRWMDQDAFGHINNVQYYSFIDSTICRLLRSNIRSVLSDPTTPKPFVVQSSCHYISPIEFPSEIDVGVLVSKVGKSSCTYRLGIFKKNAEEPSALGTFVHVWTDPVTQRPTPIPEKVQGLYESIANYDAMHS